MSFWPNLSYPSFLSYTFLALKEIYPSFNAKKLCKSPPLTSPTNDLVCTAPLSLSFPGRRTRVSWCRWLYRTGSQQGGVFVATSFDMIRSQQERERESAHGGKVSLKDIERETESKCSVGYSKVSLVQCENSSKKNCNTFCIWHYSFTSEEERKWEQEEERTQRGSFSIVVQRLPGMREVPSTNPLGGNILYSPSPSEETI